MNRRTRDHARRSASPNVVRAEALEDRRLLAAVTLDPAFGGGAGRVYTNFGSPYDEPQAMAVQSDGKILAIGWGSSINFSLVRYLPNGSLDPTFGSGGKAVLGAGYPKDIQLQKDGKILIAGDVASSDGSDGTAGMVMRLNSDGTVDKSFGTGGSFTYKP